MEEPFAGDDKSGTAGEGPVVVKLQIADQAEVPAVLTALTLQ